MSFFLGKRNKVLLAFIAPMIQLILNPVNMLISIYNIVRAAMTSSCKFLSGTTDIIAINMYFYYTQAFNLKKHNKSGFSSTMTIEPFRLDKLFQTSPIGLRVMSQLGTVMTNILSAVVYTSVIIYIIPDYSVLSLMMVYVCITSTLFFVNYFELQNYNSLGWMLFPLSIYLMMNNGTLVFGVVLFVMGLLSITALFVFSFLAAFYICTSLDIAIVLYLFPIYLYYSFRLIASGYIIQLLTAIGVAKGGVYKRSDIKFSLSKIYLLSMMIISFLCSKYIFDFDYSVFILIIASLHIVNSRFKRFADHQSIYMSYLSVSFFVYSQGSISFESVVVFFLTINPMYGFIGSAKSRFNFECPVVTAINTRPLIESIERFFEPIAEKSTVLMSFGNPGDDYTKIFNGIRVLVEPLHYCASKKGFLLLPNWYSVFEENINNSGSLWFENTEELKEIKVNKQYIIVNTYDGSSQNLLDWLLDYEVLSKLEWDDDLNLSTLNRTGITSYLLGKK